MAEDLPEDPAQEETSKPDLWKPSDMSEPDSTGGQNPKQIKAFNEKIQSVRRMAGSISSISHLLGLDDKIENLVFVVNVSLDAAQRTYLDTDLDQAHDALNQAFDVLNGAEEVIRAKMEELRLKIGELS